MPKPVVPLSETTLTVSSLSTALPVSFSPRRRGRAPSGRPAAGPCICADVSLQISPFRDCRLHRETKNAMPKRRGGAARHARSLHLMGDSVSDSVRDRRRPGRQQSLRRGRIVWFDYDTGIQTCQAFAATFPKDAQRLKNGTYCEKISQFVVTKRRGWALKSQKKSCILYIENLHQPG